MNLIIKPCLRLSVGTYVRPLQLDHVLHTIKPTVTFSPDGSFFLHWTIFPHKDFYRTQNQLTFEFQKQFGFGNFSFTLYNKYWNRQDVENEMVTGTEVLRYQVSVPIRQKRSLDVYYSKGTIFASATIFDKKREFRFHESIDPTPVLAPQYYAPQSTILMLAPLAFAVGYYLTVVSRGYSELSKRIDKEFMFRWLILTFVILLILRFIRLK